MSFLQGKYTKTRSFIVQSSAKIAKAYYKILQMLTVKATPPNPFADPVNHLYTMEEAHKHLKLESP